MVDNTLENWGQSVKEQDKKQPIPTNALTTAKRVKKILKEQGFNPKKMKIGIEAPAGSGKTVLSKALAKTMGINHYGLDWRKENKADQLLTGGRLMELVPYTPKPGQVTEHLKLLRSQDPENYDAFLTIERTPEEIRQQIIRRGRDAQNADIIDYDKDVEVGRLAFDTLDGKAYNLGNRIKLKLKPKSGWGTEKLDSLLQQKGIDSTGLTRHQKLLSLYEKKRTLGGGWTAYAKVPLTEDEIRAFEMALPKKLNLLDKLKK